MHKPGHLFIAVLAIIVQSTYCQNRRQNYVPRGDISNDRDLVEADSTNGTGLPRTTPEPYLLFGPHGYRTFPHARCQEVPTADVDLEKIKGDWNLIEYITSVDGKPWPPHAPYLCPEQRMSVTIDSGKKKMNISQLSLEWPIMFRDVVEWKQHRKKSGVFFHEENIFALWTMKIMEVIPEKHLLFFFCIDYTIWPGWNHRGVYVLSRSEKLQKPIKRKLSTKAHRRMRMDYHRTVNTTSCNPDDFQTMKGIQERWHPHRKINRKSYRAPIHPYMSRKHRRNLKVLD